MDERRGFGLWWCAAPIFVLLIYFFVFPFLYYRPAYALMTKGLISQSVFTAPLGPIAWLEERSPAYDHFLYRGVQFTFSLFADPNEARRID